MMTLILLETRMSLRGKQGGNT
ncbi:unnamed protein product [Clonostachys rosea f. rosea IK726]|uniref:Uncharacterized protein n=1 Tax=Clonostachys rosea f. rosea IK726 TaxID=1349383 RepID=A0ACA9UJ34_BIOOC|nr:unnamed protein product [Clonostachys rosea f. rosea IK726]